MGFVLLAVSFFSYFRIQKERSILLDDLDRRARVIAKSLAPASLRAVKKPPTQDEEDLAERLSGQGRTLGILICGADGKLVARSAALESIAACETRHGRAHRAIDIAAYNAFVGGADYPLKPFAFFPELLRTNR